MCLQQTHKAHVIVHRTQRSWQHVSHRKTSISERPVTQTKEKYAVPTADMIYGLSCSLNNCIHPLGSLECDNIINMNTFTSPTLAENREYDPSMFKAARCYVKLSFSPSLQFMWLPKEVKNRRVGALQLF